MRIAEVYQSIQGEGQFAGTQSVFVRTTGCNLRCWFCDTPFTSWQPEGRQVEVAELLRETLAFSIEHIVLTGGEPLLQPDSVSYCEALIDAGKFVTIETAGTIFRPARASLMSISPKLANSSPSKHSSADTARWIERHEQTRTNREAIARLIESGPYQFKFVVDEPSDLTGVCDYLADWPQIASDRVWLMPQARTREELAARSSWLEAEAQKLGFRFSSRWQIAQYGNERGR